ncbi:MAG: TonB-dependent receptor, partial [Burkholderiales bacterium]|nr:TonB-dependent receptor [Burkholderiales bacterium]
MNKTTAAARAAAIVASAVISIDATGLTHAAGVPTLDVVDVEASSDSSLGTADSASVGTVPRERLQARPAYRPGELLEEVPGLIVTQHSGEGKANQYFVRGFNIDHGTDLRINFNGAPVNQRSHGHGQGYSDLNFLIPELIGDLQYRKGPYFADEGDFSSAGAVSFDYVDVLPQSIAILSAGEDDYGRAMIAGSPKFGAGHLLYGFEVLHNDGPWTHPDNFRKMNGALRYSQGTLLDGFSVTALAYSGKGNATNQIPRRAADSGLLGRFDTFDASDGSDSARYSLAADWRRTTGSGIARGNAYVIRNELNLFSNFTYFLDDPVNADQFEQDDKRVTTGANASHTWLANWGGCDVENTVGVQLQNDNIYNGLFRTAQRQRLTTTRADHIVESSAGVYVENRTQWAEKLRTVAGLRGDYFRFDVDSDDPANSGTENDTTVNPKLSLIFGPWAKTEYFINAAGGFHSNDARGTTITVDPGADVGENLPADRVPGLVRSKGYEVGARTAIIANLQSSLAVYVLDFDSELVFIGDAGNTEAGRKSRRIGFEFANFYTPTSWLTIDADVA